jgi:hypothetical protein
MRGATRFAIAAALVALAAQPVLAGVVYVPAVNVLRDGVQRATQLVLTNPDPANVRAVSFRLIESGVAGTPLPPGPFPIIWTIAGGTAPYSISATDLPDGKAGMLEVFPTYVTGFVVGSRLVYSKQGAYSTPVDIPAISSANVLAAGSSAYLQGIEHGNTSGVISDLGVFNLGTAAANCSMDVTGPYGGVIAAGVTFTIPALSSLLYADYFGGANQIEVPPMSWSKITCDKAFWAMAIRHNANNGDTVAVLPTNTLAQSTLTQPGAEPPPPPPPPPGGNFNFQLPGNFLTCTSSNRNWKTSITDGRVAGKTMKRIVVDFDVYQGPWDPNHNVHIYMWLQNGPSWSSSLFGYLVAVRSKGIMRFSLKYGSGASVDTGPGGQYGSTYHVTYEWNGTTRQVGYKIYSASGNLRNSRTVSLSKSSFVVGGMFYATGTWAGGGGPEAIQYGWKYYNLNVDYYQ